MNGFSFISPNKTFEFRRFESNQIKSTLLLNQNLQFLFMKMENALLTGSAANSWIHSWQFRIPRRISSVITNNALIQQNSS